MEKEPETQDLNDPSSDLTEKQKQDLFLFQIYESALSELASIKGDLPEGQEIFDYLFKGIRQYKRARELESRLKDLIFEERLRLIKAAEMATADTPKEA